MIFGDNMKRFFIILFILIGTTLFSADAGGHAAVFLSMPVGWRNIAVGGCGVASEGGVTAGWYNPAVLQRMKGIGGASGYSRLALDRWIYHVSAGWNIKNDAAVALSWVHADAGEIAGRDIDGDYTEDLRYGEEAIFLTFSKVVTSDVSIGANAKYVQARLSDISTYVIGFDVGIYGETFDDMLGLGLVYQNIGMKYQWNSAELYGTDHASGSDEEIPPNIRGGAAFRPKKIPIALTAEAEYHAMDELRLRAGISGNPVPEVTLAAGFDDGLPTFGAGYEYDATFGRFGVGYSLRLEREGLPPRHSFDLTVGF